MRRRRSSGRATTTSLGLLAAATAAVSCATLLLPAEDGLSGGSRGPAGLDSGAPDASGSLEDAGSADARSGGGCVPFKTGAVVHACETFPEPVIPPSWSYGLDRGGLAGVEPAPDGGTSFALHATLPSGADEAYARIFRQVTGATFRRVRLEFDAFRNVIEAENHAGITGLGSCGVLFGIKDTGIDDDFYLYVQNGSPDSEQRMNEPSAPRINTWRHVALTVDLERSVAEARVDDRQFAMPLLAGCPTSVTSFTASVGFFFASGPSSVYFDNVSIQTE